MRRSLILLVLAIFASYFFPQEASGQAVESQKSEVELILRNVERSDFVSTASHVFATYTPSTGDYTAKSMAAAASQFLATLEPSQKQKAVHTLQSAERREWTNLPARPNAGGIRLGDLNEKQIRAACDLLAAVLSKTGYKKIRDIMLADDQLLRDGQPRQGFGTEEFSLVIFGQPSETDAWALQLDGHHLGLNVSVAGDQVTLSPSFIGTQPEAFEIASYRIQPLSGETGLAYQLIQSLSDDQKREAILRNRRAQLLTGPGRDGRIPKAQGVSCASFDSTQKELLMQLISQWTDMYPPRLAAQRRQQLMSELDSMKFAWSGPTTDRSDVSYIIQGPSLIVEYACQDLGGNPLDHLHTMYRNPQNEYLGQLNGGVDK